MPESEKTAHYFFANPHNIPGDAESITEQINASVHQAFAEDYAIISAQQEVISRNPEYKMLPIAAGRGTLKNAEVNESNASGRRSGTSKKSGSYSNCVIIVTIKLGKICSTTLLDNTKILPLYFEQLGCKFLHVFDIPFVKMPERCFRL